MQCSGDAHRIDEIGISSLMQVSTQLLVETQGGKTIRKLTKHQNEAIKAAASDVVLAWKSVVAAEASASAANTTGSALGGGANPYHDRLRQTSRSHSRDLNSRNHVGRR